MEPKAPEDATPRTNPVTRLRGNIIETSGHRPEITVRAEEVGANLWQQLVTDTQQDQRERHISVVRNKRTSILETTPIVIGEPARNSSEAPTVTLAPQSFLKGLFTETVSHIHSHPLAPELDHLKNSIPSTSDVVPLTIPSWKGSMVIVDRGGAHLLLRTAEPMHRDKPLPTDLIEKVLKEIGDVGGTTADIQKRINGLLYEFGISYYYREGLNTDEDGTVTFRRP